MAINFDLFVGVVGVGSRGCRASLAAGLWSPSADYNSSASPLHSARLRSKASHKRNRRILRYGSDLLHLRLEPYKTKSHAYGPYFSPLSAGFGIAFGLSVQSIQKRRRFSNVGPELYWILVVRPPQPGGVSHERHGDGPGRLSFDCLRTVPWQRSLLH